MSPGVRTTEVSVGAIEKVTAWTMRRSPQRTGRQPRTTTTPPRTNRLLIGKPTRDPRILTFRRARSRFSVLRWRFSIRVVSPFHGSQMTCRLVTGCTSGTAPLRKHHGRHEVVTSHRKFGGQWHTPADPKPQLNGFPWMVTDIRGRRLTALVSERL